jgi:hypothetical protein
VDESRFWSLIEQAWRESEWDKKLRRLHPPAILTEESAEVLEQELEDEVVPALVELLQTLPDDELREFDTLQRRFENALDREDVYELLQGSDDGFLYRRAFVIGMGRRYFDALLTDPESAADEEGYWPEPEPESFLGVARVAYTGRHGDWPGWD